jgi:hypothetical protein
MDIVERLRDAADGQRFNPDLHYESASEIERLREALKKLSCNCDAICDWDFDGEVCPSWVARAALKGDK